MIIIFSYRAPALEALPKVYPRNERIGVSPQWAPSSPLIDTHYFLAAVALR